MYVVACGMAHARDIFRLFMNVIVRYKFAFIVDAQARAWPRRCSHPGAFKKTRAALSLPVAAASRPCPRPRLRIHVYMYRSVLLEGERAKTARSQMLNE